MDQPQNENSDIKNDNTMPDSTAPQPETDATSVPVTFTSSTSMGEQSTETPSDLTAGGSSTDPVSVSDPGLASVANELQALEAQQFDESGNSSGVTGVDPMEQIKADEEAEVSQLEPEPVLVSEDEYAAGQSMAVEPEPALAVEPEESKSGESSTENNATTDTLPENEPAPENTISEPNTIAGATPGVISDIITPSTTAAAVAGGTAGTNVITGTPEPVTTEAASSTSKESHPKEPKSKKGLLIAIVVIVTLLFGGAAVAAYMLSPAKDDSSASSSEETADTSLADVRQNMDTASPGETIEAKTLDDYKAVCGGGMVTNAAAFDGTGPHPIVIFEKGSDDQLAMNVLAFTDNKWSASATDPSSGRLVACISRVVASEAKLKSCPITDAATKVTVNVDYFSSDYEVEVLQAKTGESLSKFKVASTSTLCPTTATYDKVDPKIFATYDVASLETSLKDLVTRTVN